MEPNFFGTLPDSVISVPEIFRSLTLFLQERCGTELKKELFFNSDFEGLAWALTRPLTADYGPIVIVIETPQKFLCMYSDSRSITHGSFIGV